MAYVKVIEKSVLVRSENGGENFTSSRNFCHVKHKAPGFPLDIKFSWVRVRKERKEKAHTDKARKDKHL